MPHLPSSCTSYSEILQSAYFSPHTLSPDTCLSIMSGYMKAALICEQHRRSTDATAIMMLTWKVKSGYMVHQPEILALNPPSWNLLWTACCNKWNELPCEVNFQPSCGWTCLKASIQKVQSSCWVITGWKSYKWVTWCSWVLVLLSWPGNHTLAYSHPPCYLSLGVYLSSSIWTNLATSTGWRCPHRFGILLNWLYTQVNALLAGQSFQNLHIYSDFRYPAYTW